MFVGTLTSLAVRSGRLPDLLISSVGNVTLPTIVAYVVLLRLMFRAEVLRSRLGRGLASIQAQEEAWRQSRDHLPSLLRDTMRQALRGSPDTPFAQTVKAFCGTDSERPGSEDVKNEFALRSRERFGADAESLLNVGSGGPVWGVFWTLAGLSIGSLSLGLGGGLAALLVSFAIAVGTSLIGHTIGHRARQILRRLDAYNDSGSLEAAREVRRFFYLPQRALIKPETAPDVMANESERAVEYRGAAPAGANNAPIVIAFGGDA